MPEVLGQLLVQRCFQHVLGEQLQQPVAYADNTSLPEPVCAQISARIDQLLENLRQPRYGYDELTDLHTHPAGAQGAVGAFVAAVVG